MEFSRLATTGLISMYDYVMEKRGADVLSGPV